MSRAVDPTPPPSWEDVAAPGSDPARLEAAVVALVLAKGGAATLAARAATVAHEREPAPRPSEIVAAILPRVDATQRQAVAPVLDTWRHLGVRVALVDDPAYPVRLAANWPWSGAPLLLAWRGPAAGLADRPAVAIVGARKATGYGRGVAAWLAEEAGRAGVLVVSGGAVGIDAAAHRAAIGTPGGTAVVLGCGHDVRYPTQHARSDGLFAEVLIDGGWLVSELLPGTPPRAPNVLARNRIVAGAVDAVVVVEGGARSGALRTAANAADLGTTVLAVPGDIRAQGSVAPHRLLAEGATPCTSPNDLLAVLDREVASRAQDDVAPPAALTCLPPDVHAVLAAAWPRPLRIDDLAARAGVGAGALLAAVTRARVAGELAESPDGVRLRRAPTSTSA